MRIAIIGATGRTGRLATEYALGNGHDVTAVVRSPDKLGDLAQRMRVVQSDATDLDGLIAGIRGADVVISTLGHAAGGSNRVMVDGIRTTLDAMRRADVSRVSMITASGHETDGDGFFTRSIVKPILGRFLREGFADMRLAEAVLHESDAAWTIVRPPMLREGDAQGYVYRETLNVRGVFSIRRVDLAAAMIDLTLDDGFARAIVSVAHGTSAGTRMRVPAVTRAEAV